MRIVDTLMVVLGLAGIALLGWWGWAKMPEAASAIETQLQVAAQDELQRAGHTWAQVSMEGQVATVRGTQPNAARVAEAAQTALTSNGNGGLVYGGVTVVQTLIDAPAVVSPFTWGAEKSADGGVELTGFVPSDGVREQLEALVGERGGAVRRDGQSLASGAPTADWGEIAADGLSLLLMLDEGEVRLRDRQLTLSGFSSAASVRAHVAAAVSALGAPYAGAVDLRGPGLWSARHFRDALLFSGQVESEDERAEILEIAGSVFDGAIVDEMVVVEAGQNLGWMDGVRLGLPQFARFLTGEMAFDPGGDGYRFEGEASGSTLRFLTEDLERLTGPYAVTLSAASVEVAVDEIAGVDFSADPREACEAAFASVLDVNRVVFGTGSASISRESGETLDKLMAVAGRCDPALVFELGGHTDNQGARGANRVLSEARAQAVANYMAETGFDRTRLLVVGYGPDQPIADNTTPEGRSANRRLEFKVLERSEE
ncbi:MAG: OmpA family protein [Pseudomonadota bacterium]